MLQGTNGPRLFVEDRRDVFHREVADHPQQHHVRLVGREFRYEPEGPSLTESVHRICLRISHGTQSFHRSRVARSGAPPGLRPAVVQDPAPGDREDEGVEFPFPSKEARHTLRDADPGVGREVFGHAGLLHAQIPQHSRLQIAIQGLEGPRRAGSRGRHHGVELCSQGHGIHDRCRHVSDGPGVPGEWLKRDPPPSLDDATFGRARAHRWGDICNDTGHSNADWSTLHDQIGTLKYFPVNDCEGQLGKDGHVLPCPGTPDKYDIIGFTGLMIDQLYRGNDDAAIGEPGAAGTCTMAVSSLAFGQVKNLADSFGVNGCPSGPDTVSAVHIYPKKGNEFIGCAPGDLSMSCAYWYDTTLRRITWRTATTTNLKIQYDWSMNGTEGACGIHASDPNAICLVTSWQGFVTTPGRVGGGAGFGLGAVVLCDRTLGTCPDQG